MARPRSDIAPRIVQAARKHFLASGVEGASLRTIAKEAATNIGMVYYYFPTKDDLFLAVVESNYERVLADMTDALKADAPARERIRGLYRRIGRMSDEELAVIRLIIREVLTSSSRMGKLSERFMRGHIPLIMEALAAGKSEGVIDERHSVVFLLMCTFGLGAAPQIVRRIVGDRVPPHVAPQGEELSDKLADVLFEGISAPPEAKRQPARKKAG